MTLIILFLTSFVILFAALLDFEALKRGKLCIVEPIYSLEIPVTAFLAYFILKETINFYQIILIMFLVLGLFLLSLKSYHLKAKVWFEKGVLFVLFGTLFMGITNFLVGVSARETSSLMINWFMGVFLTIVCLIYLIYKGRIKKFDKNIWKQKKLILSMSFLDNAAWIAFAFALTLDSMAIVTALSESYIIIAVLIGIFLNKEKIKFHQKFGLVLAIISAILLAIISG